MLPTGMASRAALRTVVVLAHGHCFDGLVSAAMFTHLRKELEKKDFAFRYVSCGYGPNMPFAPKRWLRGDENAIVDFRFTESDRLTWYFDHHRTAFENEAQQHRALSASRRYFFDPTYGSCTKLIADIGKEKFGINFDPYEEWIDWAHRIDSAQFDSPNSAIDTSEPALQIAGVVEQHGDAALLTDLVPQILSENLADVAASHKIRSMWEPGRAARDEAAARIKQRLELRGQVAYADLHEKPLGSSGKFVAYALFPNCVYAVALIRMKHHFKISVGYNAWSTTSRRHDIGQICQRFGGGGHPVVGAMSFPLSKLEEAKKTASEVIVELNG